MGKKEVQNSNPSQEETVVRIPISELHPFKAHPFKVRDDEAMTETVESVREYGVLVPAIIRPREDGGYELIAGHRRKHACELAGLETMPVIVRALDDDAATIIMVDSNMQRENILPSERAQAYKMRLEAIKRQGMRTDGTHRLRMDWLTAYLGYSRKRDTPAFYAAMYLLTSNADIYSRTVNCFRSLSAACRNRP